MKQATGIEIDVIPEILQFFSLEVPTKIQLIKESISNHNYLVETPNGKYVVRFLVNQSIESIKNDVIIQKKLAKVNVYAPKYIQNNAGVYVFNRKTITAVVSKKLDGIMPRITNTKLAYEFGHKLALFHSSIDQLPHINNKGLMNPQVSGISSSIYSMPLPSGIIHGDFHLGNVLVDSDSEEKILAILDFEEAGKNLYIVDLAVTIMAICSLKNNVMDPALIKETFQGYEAVRKLKSIEKEVFSEAAKYAAKTWIKWFKENDYDKYAKRHQERLDTFKKLDIPKIFTSP